MKLLGRRRLFEAAILTVAVINGPALGQNGWTDDGSVVRLTNSTDNVGIGTASPSTDLEVNGDIRAGQIYLDDSWGTVAFGVERGTGGYKYSVTGVPPYRFLLDNTNDNFKLQYYDSGTIGNTATGLTTAMTWDGGNVGIGTVSPVARLDIMEDGNNPGLRLNHGGNNLYATIQGPLNRDLRFVLRDNDWSDKFAFRNAAGNNLMFIRSDGIVNIGTVSIPQGFAYKLAVDGKIICEEVKVKDSGSWPDHVFKADYDLMPLPDVERYIAEHQHLPDVPSAEEVAADGLSLGETQALLLQKIEELTLYMIDLDKENQALKELVAELEIR